MSGFNARWTFFDVSYGGVEPTTSAITVKDDSDFWQNGYAKGHHLSAIVISDH